MRHDRLGMFLGAAAALLIALPAQAQDLDDVADLSWIRINGSVTSVSPSSFDLDYGDGSIRVEVDDGDRDADAYMILVGDSVVVTGRMDDDLFETATLEAQTVWVVGANLWVVSDPADEEGGFTMAGTPEMAGTRVLQGIVTEVRGGFFTMSTGNSVVTVWTHELPENPLDNEGEPQIDVGDAVSVGGYLDIGLFHGRRFVAQSLVELLGNA